MSDFSRSKRMIVVQCFGSLMVAFTTMVAVAKADREDNRPSYAQDASGQNDDAQLQDSSDQGMDLGDDERGEKSDGGKLTLDPEPAALPQLVNGQFQIPPLTPISIATDDVGNGRIPQGFRGDAERPIQALAEQGMQRGEPWPWTIAHWAAPNTYSFPRYYEDRMLERHGHERFGHLQSLASGARFFATTPILPYLMTLQPACDCEYTLGYYRSGSCAPMTYQRPPWNRRAAIAETAAVATAILAIP